MLVPDAVRAQEKGYLFYHPEIEYGSHAMRSPVDIFLNRGMSILVVDGPETRLTKIPWDDGWISVRNAFAHPGDAIRRAGGTKTWLKWQYLPTGWEIYRWAFAPNYTGHMLAGGITYRFLSEWNDYHDVPLPRVTAAVTYMAMMLTNEVIENPTRVGEASTIADLGINDPIGIIIFSFNQPARFVATKLQAADWSPQATIVFPGARVMNVSQLMSYKVPLPLTDRFRISFLIGQGGAIGGMVKLNEEYNLTAAGGFQAEKRFIDPVTGDESIKATYGGALYLDRNNSLMVSALLRQSGKERFTVNVYPGTLPGRLGQVGFWASKSAVEKGWSAGVALRQTMGIGSGFLVR